MLGSIVASVAVVAADSTGRLDPLPPGTVSPEKDQRSTIVPVPYRHALPAVTADHKPRLSKMDTMDLSHKRPAVDVPPMPDSIFVSDAALPTIPPIRWASPDPNAISIHAIANRQQGLSSDDASVAEAVRHDALKIMAPPRMAAPPPENLYIPDPTHQPGAVVSQAKSDEELPQYFVDRPAVSLSVK